MINVIGGRDGWWPLPTLIDGRLDDRWGVHGDMYRIICASMARVARVASRGLGDHKTIMMYPYGGVLLSIKARATVRGKTVDPSPISDPR